MYSGIDYSTYLDEEIERLAKNISCYGVVVVIKQVEVRIF